MSRVSDTRIRTREAATHLVVAGRRPHEITVDLIYAEIRQGSRTTINEELKLWKDEQAKADALSATLPPPVANAMMTAWALAVEHGEKVFEQRQTEVENELIAAHQRTQALETELAGEQKERGGLQAELASRQTKIETLQNEISRMLSAVEAVQTRNHTLEQQLESLREEAEQRLTTAKTKHDHQLAELRGAMNSQELAFRTEISKATERLEGVQKHVILQVAEASVNGGAKGSHLAG